MSVLNKKLVAINYLQASFNGSQCFYYTTKGRDFVKESHPLCERFLGSVRRECLDHVLIVSEKRLHRVLRELMTQQYFSASVQQEMLAA